jgi:predicted enzyme related to lactoylglutathione lyase
MPYICNIYIINDIKMKKITVRRMTGLILSSVDPSRLANFYKNVLGIPLALNKHGNLPEHWECDFDGIHYAILKEMPNDVASSNIVPSFEVEDIKEFVNQNNLAMLHPLMPLGGGDFVGSISDVDGNVIRLWMSTGKTA